MESVADLLLLMGQGHALRSTGSTGANETSSRSHQVGAEAELNTVLVNQSKKFKPNSLTRQSFPSDVKIRHHSSVCVVHVCVWMNDWLQVMQLVLKEFVVPTAEVGGSYLPGSRRRSAPTAAVAVQVAALCCIVLCFEVCCVVFECMVC